MKHAVKLLFFTLTLLVLAAVLTLTALAATDGATVQELAYAAAGDTNPFVRLTGAPYWARENNTLSAVIESNRMQLGWFKDSGIEMISEGDPYPRPRSRIPAAYSG